MTPPTPVHNSNTSFEREQGSYEEEGRGWNARERTIITRTEQFLERSYCVKVRVEELEGFLPERSKRRERAHLEKPEDWSHLEPETRVDVLVVLDVSDVLVSPSSVVTEFCDGLSCCSDREDVVPQSFSFSKKRARSWTVTQEEMRFESAQVKAPPLSRRRTMPPTPLQISYLLFEEEQEHFEVEDQIWSARDRTIIARTKPYLEECFCMKVEVEELEFLLDF